MTAEAIAGTGDVLLLCDHASAHVPEDIDLGIDPALLDLHIALDIGAGPVTRALAAELGAPALLGTVSRLVVDLHRETDHPGLVPHLSDGHAIPGNQGVDRFARIARFHVPYHRAIAAQIRAQRPRLILSIHSFTPRLETAGPELRPWHAGILYNCDTRAAAPAVEWLRAQGIETGDNQPYSGRHLNATLNRHAEGRGIPSIAVEIRNDLIRDDAGVAHWAEILACLTDHLRTRLATAFGRSDPATRNSLARNALSAT